VIPPAREPKDLQAIQLPVPSSRADMSVFAALQKRKTTREISATRLPLQLLSDLLWAAYGVNREIGPFGIPGRTAASASNSQEIDLYVALSEGVYVYDAVNNLLVPTVAGDFRVDALTPGQRGIDAKAPVQLIYVVDVHRLVFRSPDCRTLKYKNHTILLTPDSSPATYICSLPHRDWQPGSTTATRPA
jgi:Nitroreductase family